MSCKSCGTNHALETSEKMEVIDPVCGMSVDPTKAHKITLQGEDFHFCSSGCAKRFAENPGAYITEKSTIKTAR